jgi:4-amino-4-deoxy-L-arabinose transferase-like glycosyltransferase
MNLEEILTISLFKSNFFHIKVYHLILVLILIFGFILRISYLEQPDFWIDEGISSMAGKNVFENLGNTLDSGKYYARAEFFHYFLAVSFLIFGVNDFAARFPSVLFGLIIIILAYLFGKEFTTKNKHFFGLTIALFFSIFIFEVFYSKQARFYQFFQLVFFLTIYFFYKSKGFDKFFILGLVSFFITLNTQIAGVFLLPLIGYKLFLLKNSFKKNYLPFVIILIIVLFFSSIYLLASFNTATSIANLMIQINFFEYLSYLFPMFYLVILFLIGLLISFKKNFKLMMYLIVPSLIFFISILNIELFAFRYFYPLLFPFLLFSYLTINYIYEKYSFAGLISLFILVILPSNLFFPLTYTNMIVPSKSVLFDYSAPIINYKDIPLDFQREFNDNLIVTLYPVNFSWYFRSPDYVINYSMDGRKFVNFDKNYDVYTGSKILGKDNFFELNGKKFYFIQDHFSNSKKPQTLIDLKRCELIYFNSSLNVFQCDFR